MKKKKSRLISCATILLGLLLTSLASAIEPEAFSIIEGQKAPYTGQLLSTERAIKLVLKADFCEAETKVHLERAKSLKNVEISRITQLYSIDRDAWLAKEKVYREAVPSRLENILIVAGTFFGTVVLLWLTDRIDDKLPR